MGYLKKKLYGYGILKEKFYIGTFNVNFLHNISIDEDYIQKKIVK